MSSAPQDYALEAETVSGGAEAARGVTLRERAIVGGHLVWELEQDAATMEREIESYWSPSLVRGDPEHDGYTVEYGPSLGFELQSLSRSFVWKPGHLPRDLTGPYLEIFNALLAEYGGGLPEDIDEDTPGETTFSLSEEAQRAVPLYIASQIFKEDDISMAVQYLNEYENVKEMLNARSSQTASGGGFTSVLGWV